MAADPTLEHFEFWHSHYCEKSRWAIEYKGLPYTPRVLVPLGHAARVIALSGQRQVPVIRHGDRVVVGSTAILEHVEAEVPDPPLYPADAEQRGEVERTVEWFDRKLGPGIRRAVFFVLMPETDYFQRILTRPAGAVGRRLYRLANPLVKAVMRKAMAIDAAGAERGRDITRQALDRVAAAGDGFLVGDRFTAADLTAAALLYPAVFPEGGPEMLPDRPPAVEQWLALWADHPGTAWVRRIYRDHRRPA